MDNVFTIFHFSGLVGICRVVLEKKILYLLPLNISYFAIIFPGQLIFAKFGKNWPSASGEG